MPNTTYRHFVAAASVTCVVLASLLAITHATEEYSSAVACLSLGGGIAIGDFVSVSVFSDMRSMGESGSRARR